MTQAALPPSVVISARASGLRGRLDVPGDKSVSHRALMFGALAVGETVIEGLLEGEDVLNTAKAMAALGADVQREDGDSGQSPVWRVRGCGVGGLAEPDDVLDMGNSGTGARLLMGLLAAHPMTSTVTGDASLRRRPMDRIITPLSRMGARFEGRAQGRLPLTVIGTDELVPLVYESPVASAQIKSAVLLAGLHARGATTVIEPAASRDHTERMLAHFGAEVEVAGVEGRPGAVAVTVRGHGDLKGCLIRVPGDPSSAAFPLVAALITADSEIILSGVGLNPYRTGLLDTLQEMGADIVIENKHEAGGEPVGDLIVRSSKLKGVTVPAERVPSMIDEFPILAVAAACAEGETRMTGLAELRVKESDRLTAIAEGLGACGVKARIDGDDLVVTGTGGQVAGNAVVKTQLDHRIAMSFLVLGLAADKPIGIDDDKAIATSYPEFMTHMGGLGAAYTQVDRADTEPAV